MKLISALLLYCLLSAPRLTANPAVSAQSCKPSTALLRESSQVHSATWTGTATWYNRKTSGKTMANGEPMDESKLTAALPWKPDGSLYKVTTKTQQGTRSVVVRHSDRGPAKWTGHAIDLTPAAFRKLASLGQGEIRVRIERVK